VAYSLQYIALDECSLFLFFANRVFVRKCGAFPGILLLAVLQPEK
jgi:hypothetical protein